MKFRKKPVVVEAVKYDGTNSREILDFATDIAGLSDWSIYIYTLEGRMLVSKGDWVVRGVKGEFYPCRSDIFEMTYDPVYEPPLVSQPSGM